jgi:hypothetical protein
MSSSSDNKVVVHVEVEVNGVPVGPTELEKGYAKFKPFALGLPQPSPLDTPVFWYAGSQSAGICCATGSSPIVNQQFATIVKAIAVPSTTVNLLDPKYASPPNQAATTTIINGNWQFWQASGNPVLGGAGDSIPGNPNNSTLLVWFLFTGATVLEATLYHGLYMNSGSTCPSGSAGVGVSNQFVARSKSKYLVARFRGALAPLREVSLTWNGVNWVGMAKVEGGVIITLMECNGTYQLQAAGPAATFVVAGRPKAIQPFHWSVSGVAIGGHHGEFHVDITE